MAETNISLSPYQANKFVNRDKEIEQVLSILRQSQPGVRTFVFDGDRGVGKTWLSLHFHRTKFKEIKGLISWLFSLSDPGEGYQPWGEKLQENEKFVLRGEQINIENFLSIIIGTLSIELPPKPSVPEIVDAVRRYVQSHVDTRFIMILDSAYESNWPLLEQLETHFLGNLLTLSNFFVIVTGRGRPYPWKVPYLIEAIRHGLGKFSQEQIEEQLEKFGLSSTLSPVDIYKIGQGWPILTEILAHAKNRSEALDIAAKILFLVVPATVRKKIRTYFEALCPLEGFGESEAALMVKTYGKSETQDGRTICREMNETRLISWKDGRYVINQPVGNVLRQYLQNQKQDQKKNDWIRLNCAAFRHFEKQYKDPSLKRFQAFFEERMKTHKQALSEAGVRDPQTCPANEKEEEK